MLQLYSINILQEKVFLYSCMLVNQIAYFCYIKLKLWKKTRRLPWF